MRNTSIALSEHWIEFTKKQVESGRYGSTSEVVREGLRLIEARQKYRDSVEAALIAGEQSRFIHDFDFDAYIAAIGDAAESKAA